MAHCQLIDIATEYKWLTITNEYIVFCALWHHADLGQLAQFSNDLISLIEQIIRATTTAGSTLCFFNSVIQVRQLRRITIDRINRSANLTIDVSSNLVETCLQTIQAPCQ